MLHQGVRLEQKNPLPVSHRLRDPILAHIPSQVVVENERCIAGQLCLLPNSNGSEWWVFEMASFNSGETVPVGIPCVVDQMGASGVSQRLTSVCGCHRYMNPDAKVTFLLLEA